MAKNNVTVFRFGGEGNFYFSVAKLQKFKT